MSTELRVGVAGATGALGSEIVKVLDAVRWRPAEIVPLARATSATSHVEYGGERVAVDDLRDEALEGLDALFLALPEDIALETGEAAVQEGVPTIDCSGAFLGDADVPMVVPWVNPEGLAAIRRGLVSVPGAEALLLASVFGPLRRAGITGPINATVLLPASAVGKAGIEELSGQVVAMFNSSPPPRKVFEHGLAFDLDPSLGGVGTDDWTTRERRVVDEVSRLMAVSHPMDVTLVRVPVFSGISAAVTLTPTQETTVEEVVQVLARGGVRMPEAAGPRYLPRPRRVEGEPFARAGRIRLGADGGTVHAWLAMDNLHTVALAAVSCAAAMLGVGRDC